VDGMLRGPPRDFTIADPDGFGVRFASISAAP
jgi:hypothetical protein